MPDYLKSVLEVNLPQSGKKNKVTIAVGEKVLAGSIKAAFPGTEAETADNSVIARELSRGIRLHAQKLIPKLQPGDIEQAARGLGHYYSRSKVKFDVKRNDQHIIQAIATLEHDDKSNNTFLMRIREWYGWHFPELSKIVPDNIPYAKLALEIGDKATLTDDRLHDLAAIIGEDGEKAQAIIDAAKVSMGTAISDEDHLAIKQLVGPVLEAVRNRNEVAAYLERTLNNIAPNLQMLIGTVVAARLVSAAGSLINLAKMPASTLQILGAEKALFRALKTKSNTPKYGLIYHSSFIGRASQRDKGRISRYLANKCSIAARIDAFSEEPSTKFGEALKQQIEDRLEFYATGKRPAKNADVMEGIMKSLGDVGEIVADGADLDEEMAEADSDEEAPKKSKKSKKDKKEKKEKKEKKRKRESDAAELVNGDDGEKKKKKKKKSKTSDDE